MRQKACKKNSLEYSGIPSPISASGSDATKCLAATDQPTVQAEFAFPEVASLEAPKISAPIPEAIADPKEPSIPPVVGEPEVASTPLPETGGRSAASHHAPSRQIRPGAAVAKPSSCGRAKSSPEGRSARPQRTRTADDSTSGPAANIDASTGASSGPQPAAQQPPPTTEDPLRPGRLSVRRASDGFTTLQRLRRKKKRVEIYLTPETHAAAQSLARRRNLHLSGLIISLLAAATG